MKNFTSLVIIILSLIASFLFPACNDELSPNGELTKNYTAYSILDTRQNKQVVFIQKLYFNNNSGNKLDNIVVTLSENGGQSYKFKDTSISGYNKYTAFYLPNYKLKRDMNYKLNVFSNDFPSMWSDTYVEPALNSTNFFVKETITAQKGIKTWKYTLKSPKPKSNPCLIRFFIKFTRFYDDYYLMPQEKSYVMELPIAFTQNITIDPADTRKTYEFSEGAFALSYSSFITSKKWDPAFSVADSGISVTITDDNFIYPLLHILFSPQSLVINKAFAVYYTVDNSIYENYIAAVPTNYSVRLDEPFIYTNFSTNNGNGIGYFGSVTADTCEFKINPEFFTKFGYRDGQY
jgi:hypothetical protein